MTVQAPPPPSPPHGLCSVGTDPLGASPGQLFPASVLGDCFHVVSIQDPFNTLLHFSVRAFPWGSSPGPRAPGPLSARMARIFASHTELQTQRLPLLHAPISANAAAVCPVAQAGNHEGLLGPAFATRLHVSALVSMSSGLYVPDMSPTRPCLTTSALTSAV